ncbi:hypothetical protein Q2T46_10645 [Thermoanaerobacterium sp. CMT5567-10]|uniref:hypothetical protein n=1 Tax=Thermoanaerobacterium sp. CMT5567-10 TaxID=3061989 RepID=UPI0026E06D0B|nr:hypothetical protein [Thermoanaerobacterium sp. CMT5567-10]WKV08001.1 hypothetical protein Q2T46_10645 [Thermoanaerobacterium sp. CMT5567-10]
MQSNGLINSNINIKVGKIKDINIILLSSMIGSLNVLFYKNYQISMIIITAELTILAYYFMKKDITRYIGSYLIFLSLSFEFNELGGTEQFYGFKNFRIFGINLGILSLLPLLVIVLSKKIKINEIKNKYTNLHKFIAIIIFMDFMGVIFGLLQLITNDNNIQNMDGMLPSFVGTTYNMVALPILLIISIIYILT